MRSLGRRTQDEVVQGYEDTKTHMQMNTSPSQQNEGVALQQINSDGVRMTSTRMMLGLPTNQPHFAAFSQVREYQ